MTMVIDQLHICIVTQIDDGRRKPGEMKTVRVVECPLRFLPQENWPNRFYAARRIAIGSAAARFIGIGNVVASSCGDSIWS